MTDRHWRILRVVEDLPDNVDDLVRDTVDGWFGDEPRLSQQEFIDQFCQDHGGSENGGDDWDIEDYLCPASKKIMRIAREYHRELRL